MAQVTRAADSRAGTLAAATPLDVDLDVRAARSLAITLRNTGVTNPINTVAVFISADGLNFAENAALTAKVGSVAASGSALLEAADLAAVVVRLRLTSTAGTTYALEMRGT